MKGNCIGFRQFTSKKGTQFVQISVATQKDPEWVGVHAEMFTCKPSDIVGTLKEGCYIVAATNNGFASDVIIMDKGDL